MKKENSSIRAAVIKRLAKEHKVTTRFVRQSINRERLSLTAERILKDYRELMKEAEELLG